MAYYDPYDYPHPYRTDSGDATISIGVGSLSITRYQPVIAAAVAVAIGIAALSITGYAPTVIVETTISVEPGAGTISITGYQPSVASDHTVAIGSNTIAITGYTPGVANRIFTVTESASVMYVDQLDGVAAFSVPDAAHVLHLFRSELLAEAPFYVPIGSGSLAVSGQQPVPMADVDVAVLCREKVVPIGTQVVSIC